MQNLCTGKSIEHSLLGSWKWIHVTVAVCYCWPWNLKLFPFSALTLLVWPYNGVWLVKIWVLVCCWWQFGWIFAHLVGAVVTTTFIILSSSKIRNDLVLLYLVLFLSLYSFLLSLNLFHKESFFFACTCSRLGFVYAFCNTQSFVLLSIHDTYCNCLT